MVDTDRGWGVGALSNGCHTICKIFRIAYTVILNGKIPNTFLCIVLNTTAKGKSYFII